ncbi:hypothetical protein [Myroides odoratimimus]|uniref:hypothetical protein n=1 Tax=Myroides odoratimimus TaxID=76832 RepID=UPI002DB7D1B8|nr:hypothetical protein [Myroides odoratimimus]MEC4036567.1 hypothetical protein [Myroides odoratimimus]
MKRLFICIKYIFKKKVERNNIWSVNSYIKDVKTLKDLIRTYNIDGDFVELDKVIEKLNNSVYVDYNIKDLAFWIRGGLKDTKPKEENFNFIIIQCDNQVAVMNPMESDSDPLYIYSLNIKLTLKKSKLNEIGKRQSSWHLDKEKEPEKCHVTHPYYHFQFGGKKLEYLEEEMGLLSSPRIPHPPMDILLLFHFIINNYYPNNKFEELKKILSDPDYIRIINNSKRRIWDHYFNSFKNNKNRHYTLERVFPLYTM